MHRLRHILAGLALLAIVRAAPAAADDLSLMAEPRYSEGQREFTDQAGSKTTLRDRALVQGYRLMLDRALLPGLRFSGMGVLEDTNALGAGSTGQRDFRTTTVNANLGFGDRLLGGNAGYSRREDRDRSPGALGPRLNDSYSLSLGWSPEAAPAVSLRANRSNVYDSARRFQDTTSDLAALGVRYVRDDHLRLEGTLTYAGVSDQLNLATTRNYGGSALGSWNGKMFGDRTTAALSYGVGANTTETVATGEGGVVSTQRIPAPGSGLSLIDDATTNPEMTTLERNAALVDGNTTAGANLNIGYRASTSGDTRLRELGAEFPDAVTEVNVISVWVDRQLRGTVPSALATSWAVFRSDDNVTWTPVALAGAAVAPPFENRFDIPIQRTAARYLKVVTRPLPAGITLDEQYADVFITEIQFYQRAPAADVRGRTASLMNQVNLAARTPIAPVRGLAHDFSGIVRRSDAFGDRARSSLTAASMTNGLSLVRKLTPTTVWNARLTHQDTYDMRGYDGTLAWGSSLALRPLPTLSNSLSYAGALRHGIDGISTQNSVSVMNRAQVYRWLGLDTAAGGSVNGGSTIPTTRSAQLSVFGNVIPHPLLRLSSGWRLRYSWGANASRSQTVDATAAFNPTEATSVSASVMRVIEGARPTTLGSVSLGLSPFQGGALELRLSASRSLDSTAEQVGTTAGAGARWNIRSGWYFDVGYTFLDLEAPTGRSRNRELSAGLVATLF